MNLSANLLNFAILVIDRIGYLGVSFILIIDNAGVPIPSEAILALSGATARTGHFNELIVIFLGITMQTLGSSLSYWIGLKGGGPFIKKYGKYLLISAEDYDKTHEWFAKRGPRAVFISRLTPVVRTFMGFVAGTAEMNFGSFLMQSLAGSALWTFIWAGFGYALGDSWRYYYEYLHYVDYLVILVAAILVGHFVWKRRSRFLVRSKRGK